jgi:hypothetical protein
MSDLIPTEKKLLKQAIEIELINRRKEFNHGKT